MAKISTSKYPKPGDILILKRKIRIPSDVLLVIRIGTNNKFPPNLQGIHCVVLDTLITTSKERESNRWFPLDYTDSQDFKNAWELIRS